MSERAIYGLDGLTLGERIRRARRGQKRTQREVAFSAELNPFQVLRWETDQCVPSLYAFASLADHLGISMERLYWGPLLPEDMAPREEVAS